LSSHLTAPNSPPSAPVLKSGASEKGATAAPLWRLATAGALGTPPASNPNLELACIAWTSFVGRQVREPRVAVLGCADYGWDDGGSGSCSPPLSPRRTQVATTALPFRIRLAPDGEPGVACDEPSSGGSPSPTPLSEPEPPPLQHRPTFESGSRRTAPCPRCAAEGAQRSSRRAVRELLPVSDRRKVTPGDSVEA